MKHSVLITPILVTLFLLVTWQASLSSSGSTFAHKVNGMFFSLAALGLAFGSAVSAIVLWRRSHVCRNYSILLLALSSASLVGSTWYRVNQNSFVIGKLESAYDSIAKKGTPFPLEREVQHQFLEILPDSYSTGYCVSPDRQSFEVFYHDSSNSYTMKLPEKSWVWRENGYRGTNASTNTNNYLMH